MSLGTHVEPEIASPRASSIVDVQKRISLTDLFPLPLTPLETFLVWDETEACPLTSFIELHFEGRLDRKALQASLDEVAEHHPLLSCRIETKHHRLSWHHEKTLSPLLRDGERTPVTTGPADNPRPIPFDLSRESGVRFWLLDEGTGSRIIIQLHHACCDGVGLRQVLLSTLSAYAKRTSNNDAATKNASTASPSTRKRRLTGTQTDPSLLRNRFDFTELESKPPKTKLSFWQQLQNAYYFHVQRPTEIRSDDQQSGNDFQSDEPLLHHVFDKELSTRILAACRERSIGVNELAIATLFTTCQKWNARLGDRKPGSRLRLLMPVDLRSRSDLALPATNRLSFAFLGRTHRQCANFEELLAGVCEETQHIKETRVYMDFLHGLSAAHQHPKAMKWAIGKSRRMTTTVLTYAGDISRGMKNHFPEIDGGRQIGDAKLTNVMICPPPRQHANVSLGLCINWGQICVSAAWNRNMLNVAMTQRFLTLYASQWQDWLARGVKHD